MGHVARMGRTRKQTFRDTQCGTRLSWKSVSMLEDIAAIG
jgi:hypothetical protein